MSIAGCIALLFLTENPRRQQFSYNTIAKLASLWAYELIGLHDMAIDLPVCLFCCSDMSTPPSLNCFAAIISLLFS